MSAFHADIAALHAEASEVLAPARFKAVGRPRFALAALARSFKPAARQAAAALAERVPLGQQLSAIDQKLVERLTKEEYLLAQPVITNSVQRKGLFSRHGRDQSISSIGWSGVVQLYPSLEGELQFLSGHATSELSQKALARWLVVLHEVAHAEFSQIFQPFAPSQDAPVGSFLAPLRHWVFSKLNDQSYPLVTLNECFADVYSSMLLLEMTDHHYQAEACVKRMMVKRELLREELEYNGLGECHTTDFALAAMWEGRQSWRGKPASELKALAREYASDATLKLMDPKRTARSGQIPIGQKLRGIMCTPKLELMTLMLEQLSALAGGVDNRLLLRRQLVDHPVRDLCFAFMDELHQECTRRPDLFKSAQKNLLDTGKLGVRAVSGLSRILDGYEKALKEEAAKLGFDAPLKEFIASSNLGPCAEPSPAAFIQARPSC